MHPLYPVSNKQPCNFHVFPKAKDYLISKGMNTMFFPARTRAHNPVPSDRKSCLGSSGMYHVACMVLAPGGVKVLYHVQVQDCCWQHVAHQPRFNYSRWRWCNEAAGSNTAGANWQNNRGRVLRSSSWGEIHKNHSFVFTFAVTGIHFKLSHCKIHND